jgi:hypothetical protein
MQKRLARCLLKLVAFAIVTALAVPAAAQAQSKTSQKNDDATVVVAGQTVAIDKETGRLRQPTASEARALAAALGAHVDKSDTGLTMRQHANGAISVDLQGRFQSVAVAHVDQAGNVSQQCVTNAAEAEKAIATMSNKKKPASKSKRGTGRN